MNFVYFAAGIAVSSALFLVGMNYGPGHKEIVAAYSQGRADALKTNPVSWDLEQACVSLWVGKQHAK